MALSLFLSEETGAVTVDWVVLTAATVGLGLATSVVVASGVGSLSNETADELEGQTIRQWFTRTAAVMGFENGRGNWLGGVISDGPYGNVLRGGGSGGLQSAQGSFSLEGDPAFAVATFDMHAIDSWDGENFLVYVDNQVVATASFDHFGGDGLEGTWVSDNPDITFSVQSTSAQTNVGYNGGFADQSFQMQVTVANPSDQMTLGFGSTLDQGVDDESWAVDNISVVGASSI
ncbi:MAG: hypothetical protein AAGA70_03405 [Pseudomonadota bacterium]